MMNAGGNIVLNPNEHLVAFHESLFVRFLSLSYYIVVNVWLLIFPNQLCSDWSFGTIPLLETISDVRVPLVLLLYLVLSVVAYRVFFFGDRAGPSFAPLKMGIAIGALTYLPSSGFLFKVGFVIAERVLYMPRSVCNSMWFCWTDGRSIGYCLVLVWLLTRVPKGVRVFVVLVLLGFLSAKSIHRNTEWLSNYTSVAARV
jgi:hypothetical protein